ncbi:MAG: molybdopterin molybdotransferase MoeA, partial [Planctomycetota bacterium]|nr:molybdopterin molybdotransferase MoeA [Planctomycetota bacterium]
AILATGSELVEIGKKPGPGQIRNSNSYALAAQSLDAGASFAYLGIAADDPQSLAQKVVSGLAADVLLLSGGVSVGDRDIVPDVLAGAGVEILFHKVAMKPGRPVLFGKKGTCLVFGLPGNPVSAFVGFEVFVRPVLAHLVGDPAIARAWVSLPLAEDVDVVTDRTWFAPARVDRDVEGNGTVALVQSRGSADIPALSRGNALAVFPGETATYRKGTRVRTILLGDVGFVSSTGGGR